MMYTYTKLFANGEAEILCTLASRIQEIGDKPPSCIVDCGGERKVLNVPFAGFKPNSELMLYPFSHDDDELLKLPLNTYATDLLRQVKMYQHEWWFVLGDVFRVDELPF